MIIDINTVSEKTSLSRSTIRRWVKNKTFPQPSSLGPRRIGWLSEDIDKWVTEKFTNA